MANGTSRRPARTGGRPARRGPGLLAALRGLSDLESRLIAAVIAVPLYSACLMLFGGPVWAIGVFLALALVYCWQGWRAGMNRRPGKGRRQ